MEAKKILREYARKQIDILMSPLNTNENSIVFESFLHREDNYLNNVMQSFKSLLINMKDFEKKHNIDFFKQLLTYSHD